MILTLQEYHKHYNVDMFPRGDLVGAYLETNYFPFTYHLYKQYHNPPAPPNNNIPTNILLAFVSRYDLSIACISSSTLVARYLLTDLRQIRRS